MLNRQHKRAVLVVVAILGGLGVGSAELNPDTTFVAPGFIAQAVASGLHDPREVVTLENGDVLVLEAAINTVTLLPLEDRGDAIELAVAPGLNHGLEFAGDFIYASSPSDVYRWPYKMGSRTPLSESKRQTVIERMGDAACWDCKGAGGHSTRTIRVDPENEWIYVSIGSAGNVDINSFRSRIRRFNLGEFRQSCLAGACEPFEFDVAGELFADGLRNEVGLAFDADGVLWGIENGADNLYRKSLGGDIHTDNPAEELNRFGTPGLFYGYPLCFSEFYIPALGRNRVLGRQWAWPAEESWENMLGATGINDDASTQKLSAADDWCQDPDNVVLPIASLQGHTAPLGLDFFPGNVAAPAIEGGVLIPNHGSWNREAGTGYNVQWLPFSPTTKLPCTQDPLLLFGAKENVELRRKTALNGETWDLRPVAVSTLELDGDISVFVTSDSDCKWQMKIKEDGTQNEVASCPKDTGILIELKFQNVADFNDAYNEFACP